jgi:hypothetical protein
MCKAEMVQNKIETNKQQITQLIGEKKMITTKKRKKHVVKDIKKGREIGNGYDTLYLTQGKEAKVSPEDYSRAAQFRWHYLHTGYAYSNRHCKITALHRFIMDHDVDDRNIVVDHINGDTLDCRRENLRICTMTENVRHKTKLSCRNKSGYIGVYSSVNGEKWYAFINVDKKHIHLGSYDNVEMAVGARRLAELLYFGEFASTIKPEVNNDQL